MAILLKSLFFLSLLFVSGSAFPFIGGLLGDADKTVDQGVGMVANGGGADDDATSDAKNRTPDDDDTGVAQPDFNTNFLGDWMIHNPNAGVSSMHLQLLPTNKAIMTDATNLGPSDIKLADGKCRPVPGAPVDCWAHAVEYDIDTAEVRPLEVLSNPWCSAGGLTIDGSLISVGGTEEGNRSVRILKPCQGCDFMDQQAVVSSPRWYSSQEKLEDGSFIIFGGRREYSYEYVQSSLTFPQRRVPLLFLNETDDDKIVNAYENNLYPFVHLLPDGTIFLLANRRAVIISTETDTIVRELPRMPGGSRNYPASGMSALLPLKISNDGAPVQAEVMVCGGAKPEAAWTLDKKKQMLLALTDCGRITPSDPNAFWAMENMPSRRVMGDLLLLPTAQALILSGAMQGVAGWGLADSPNLTPLLYTPENKVKERFQSLTPSTIARMYHSSAALLPDGTILVAGSNSHPRYTFTGPFPTELRVEKFSPPYLDPVLDAHRPLISEDTSDKTLAYGEKFSVAIELEDAAGAQDFKLTMLHPPFTTHGYSQSQRLLVLEPVSYVNGIITAVAPPSGKLAPPGYYILYVVHRGVPSRGMWVQIA